MTPTFIPESWPDLLGLVFVEAIASVVDTVDEVSRTVDEMLNGEVFEIKELVDIIVLLEVDDEIAVDTTDKDFENK